MLWLVIAATVWALTLWQWRRTPEAVSGQDIVLHLLVLPLVLTAVAWLAWRGVKRLRALADRPLDAVPTSAVAHGLAAAGERGAPAPAPAPFTEVPEQPVATVLAEALCLSAGHGAAEAWHALKEARVRPSLDPELSDADGLPVFSARVADLDLNDWLLAHGELGHAGSTPLPDPVLRTLALLEAPLHHLLDALAAWRPEPGERPWQGGAAARAHEPMSSLPAGAPSHLSGVGRPDGLATRQARAERAPALQVRLCLPAAWTHDDRARAVAWVRSQCGALLDWTDAHGAPAPEWQTAWPSAQPMSQGSTEAVDATEAAEASPERVWAELASHWLAWSASPRPQLLLLLAADTAVDEACVAQWQARGELFTSHHQRGRVPGEAGVGLLLANRAWEAWCHMPPDALLASGLPSPSARDDIAACPRMWRPQVLRRERSADVIGRVDASGTQALLQRVVQCMAPHADGDWTLVSDGDHRASRTAEVFEALLAVRPQADPMLSVVRVGDGCGDMGLARSLVSVALGSAGLRQGEPAGMALALLVQDALERVAVPLTPPSASWPTAVPMAASTVTRATTPT
ncbi:hypothetical protein EV672_10296 [Aquabacterium commune]|uniref:Uncharacterized protein n=2 Tax=Aquabacterium commune TaxID=70586 RepID=A0A4R6RIP6_9BURK|nr:hypothetical protein EV672_10296 [Aquabacterium commune]